MLTEPVKFVSATSNPYTPFEKVVVEKKFGTMVSTPALVLTSVEPVIRLVDEYVFVTAPEQLIFPVISILEYEDGERMKLSNKVDDMVITLFEGWFIDNIIRCLLIWLTSQ